MSLFNVLFHADAPAKCTNHVHHLPGVYKLPRASSVFLLSSFTLPLLHPASPRTVYKRTDTYVRVFPQTGYFNLLRFILYNDSICGCFASGFSKHLLCARLK